MPMKASKWIWFDGEFVPWEDAKIHVMSHALHYGTSVFEGIRAYSTPKGPAVFRLPEHARRLLNSAKIMRMPVSYSQEEIEEAILETIRRNGHESCYIRPLIFRGYDSLGVDGRSCPVQMIIGTIEWGRYLGPEAIEKGVDVGVSSWRRMAPGASAALGKIGGQYVTSQFMVMEAKANGYTEAIGLDVYGYVSEGSGENLFLVYEGELYTAPVGQSILAGITRDSVITLAKEMGYNVREQLIAREMLYTADEVFFAGTAAEITPIKSVDGVQIGPGHRGPITKRLQEEFFGITTGKIEDRHGWLTYVNK